MQNWMTEIIEQYSYFGILLMMALENIFPPIPSEVILTFGGFMTTQSSLTVFGVILSATIGSVIGAIILYGIGYYLDVKKIEKIVERWGYLLRIKTADIHKANKWFDRYGYWTVFFCRMVPLIRSLISIPAGMTKMNFPLFLLFTTLGTFIWNIILVMAGHLLGESWEDILYYFDLYSNVVYVVLAFAGIVFLILFLRKRKVDA
ncbi:alkaline phosphatase [Brevibacillus brevis]|uniref:DedA family protein n=1 Tax=Brevibacillus brevis TaxID=1393 RepID=UPI001901AF52|nr:DedA family protein [Brevibacillus brevis]MBH0328952.1 alkaline phosphatase [Brevibacillus brevis]